MLRLLAHGHDTKSAARVLGLSIHTITERLRDARQKLGVSSSREAARILADAERGGPQKTWDRFSGIADEPGPAVEEHSGRRSISTTAVLAIIGGLLLMTMLLLLAITVAAPPSGDPTTPPKVVRTTPAAGSVIVPGPFLLSVTFDQPMQVGSYSFVRLAADTYPDCDGTPVLSGDGHTFSMLCSAKPGRRYVIGINLPPYTNFRSVTGVQAAPFQIAFSTNTQ